MPPVTHTVSCVLAAAVLTRVALAYEPLLDARAIAEAIALGQSRIDAERLEFHKRHRVPVNRAPVDYIEVVTPFRRIVLAAEGRWRVGDRLFGQREALAALGDARDQIDLFAEMTFHPLNAYVGVPDYQVTLAAAGAPGPPIAPRNLQRVPRFGARVEGMPLLYPVPAIPAGPAVSQPMLGATVIAQFDGRLLMPDGVYDAVVSESGKELARGRVNLGRLR
jgi:hypothetical protein